MYLQFIHLHLPTIRPAPTAQVAYPRIREFLSALHRRRISSFLVTNGQFPQALSTLPQVTQLYLSCDGATAEQLKSVGQPLFKDFWDT